MEAEQKRHPASAIRDALRWYWKNRICAGGSSPARRVVSTAIHGNTADAGLNP